MTTIEFSSHSRLKPTFRRAAAAARRFRRDRSGLGALEFALLLPVMMLLYFGTFEVGEGVAINQKVTHVASTLGDLVAQSRELTTADMQNILDAAEAVINPYPTGTLSLVVMQVQIDPQGRATVDWSVGRNASAPAKGSAVDLPEGVRQANSYLIMAKAGYVYQPRIGYVLSGSFTFSDEFVLRPRLTKFVQYP